MNEKIVSFSRLLNIFKFKGQRAYIIELEDSGEKELFISFFNGVKREFINIKKAPYGLKDHFENISEKCLMSECENADFMFENSNITHFEANCDNLIEANNMFENSRLSYIKSSFDNLKIARNMFSSSAIKTIDINFKNLVNGNSMFARSYLVNIDNSSFPSLENAISMFSNSALEEINVDFPKVTNGDYMFCYSRLKKINSNFDSLVSGKNMFMRSRVEKMDIIFPNLINATQMFYASDIKLFHYSSFSKVVEGSEMFCFCRNLEYLNADFSNLKEATAMFLKSGVRAISPESKFESVKYANLMFSEVYITQGFLNLPELKFSSKIFMHSKIKSIKIKTNKDAVKKLKKEFFFYSVRKIMNKFLKRKNKIEIS